LLSPSENGYRQLVSVDGTVSARPGGLLCRRAPAVAGLARNLSNEVETLGTWGGVPDPRLLLGNGKGSAQASFVGTGFVSPSRADGAPEALASIGLTT
jgi:hypothetical protein